MTPKLSFVMPSFNRLEWLGESIQSVLSQTVQEFELIIIDDGSTDGTKEFLKEWPKDERVLIVSNEENKGAGPSRHEGAKLAKAEIICICDSDDLCIDERARMTLEWFEKNPESELVSFPYVQVGYNNEIIESFEGLFFDYELYKKTKHINYFCNPGAAMKKKSYFETKGYMKEDNNKTDDRQMIENWIEAGKKVDFCPGDPIVLHRVLPDSMCVKFRGFDPAWATKA